MVAIIAAFTASAPLSTDYLKSDFINDVLTTTTSSNTIFEANTSIRISSNISPTGKTKHMSIRNQNAN
ncbi:22463_t:CDS:2 [Rhizophagus irregularis]|nr:22463_t:CDS:2 [Rhizophagus irregularis]